MKSINCCTLEDTYISLLRNAPIQFKGRQQCDSSVNCSAEFSVWCLSIRMSRPSRPSRPSSAWVQGGSGRASGWAAGEQVGECRRLSSKEPGPSIMGSRKDPERALRICNRLSSTRYYTVTPFKLFAEKSWLEFRQNIAISRSAYVISGTK